MSNQAKLYKFINEKLKIYEFNSTSMHELIETTLISYFNISTILYILCFENEYLILILN